MALRTKNKTIIVLFFILLFAVFSVFFVGADIIPFDYPLRTAFKMRPFSLGLDLVGGTHLEYEADTNAIEPRERDDALEGVREVIERRINSLGVAEPLIQTTRVGQSARVIVELAGVKEVKEAIRLIGETPLLEFKEENREPPPPLTKEQKEQIEKNNRKAKVSAEETLTLLKKGTSDFIALAKERSEDAGTKERGGDLGFLREDASGRDAVLYAAGISTGIGKLTPKVVETDVAYHVLRVEEEQKEDDIQARHILICYKGATRCEKDTTKDAARAQINELKKQATKENFTELAKQHSTEQGADTTGGDLGWFSRGRMVKSFEDAVFALKKGTISDVVETEFGFHLIFKIDERRVPALRLRHIMFKKTQENDLTVPQEQWKNTTLSGKQLARAQLQFDPTTGQPNIGLNFNDEGAKLFETITERNIDKPLAIFLDGEPLSIPRVQQKISGGNAVITGNFRVEEAQTLARRLNAGALPVPIRLLSQSTVGPILGHRSLLASLNAAYIGLALVALFMILYYRLPGFLAVIALLLYALYLLTLFRLIPVTLTLSGIAGFILSLGMAVDANILVFERMREELRAGKPLLSAIDEGFRRAWPSIRDGNITTLIAAAILFWFSASIVRGFALVLGLGVLMSMFSALVITRYLLRLLNFVKISHRLL